MASHPPPFFERFPGFRPNPSAPVSDEFSRLASHMNWNTKSKKYREMWLKCIYLEFHRHYGNESSLLEPWQRLCRELQIEAFQSISQCKTVKSGRLVRTKSFWQSLTISRPLQKSMSTWSTWLTAALLERLSKRFPP